MLDESLKGMKIQLGKIPAVMNHPPLLIQQDAKDGKMTTSFTISIKLYHKTHSSQS